MIAHDRLFSSSSLLGQLGSTVSRIVGILPTYLFSGLAEDPIIRMLFSSSHAVVIPPLSSFYLFDPSYVPRSIKL